ncbi:hypothetical protein IHE31_06080 [Mycetohabitans rhizoxinica]|uniref:hypothetical protein n=1 Tax=Mycetohabitans rhizoxinica TaxID=412963 RepID=UPI0030D0FC07
MNNAFASLKEALPTKHGVKALSQKLPSAFSTLTALQNNKGNKNHLGFRVGSMPLKDINAKWKNSFSEIKAKGASRQSSSASNKDRRELQARASDVLGQIKKLEDIADEIRRDINGNEKNTGLNKRMNHDPELHAIYDGLRFEIKSAKSKIYEIMRDNGYSSQHKGLLHGAGSSKERCDSMMRDLNNISLSMQLKLQFSEHKVKNLKHDLI